MATMRTSIHGRRLGLSSTGGIITGYDSTGGHSTAYEQQCQMWGAALYTADPDDGGTISNNGVTFLTTGTTNGSTFFLAAPVKGVQKEIHLVTSATALSIKTTADTILFNTTAATGIDVGSTNLTAAIAGGVAGSLVLRGLSTTLWSVASNTAGFSS